eukprot:1483450-Rhodomonas_salina.2
MSLNCSPRTSRQSHSIQPAFIRCAKREHERGRVELKGGHRVWEQATMRKAASKIASGGRAGRAPGGAGCRRQEHSCPRSYAAPGRTALDVETLHSMRQGRARQLAPRRR